MIDNQKVLNEMFNIPHGLKPVANISGMKLYSSKGLMKKYAKAILNTKYFKGSKRLEELIIDKNKIIPCYLTKSLIGYTFYKLFASTQRKSICGFFSPQSKRIYILISNNTAFGIYSSNNDLASLTLHETMHAYFDQSPSDFKSMFKKKIAEYYDHFVSYVFDVPDNKITKSTGKSIAKMMLDFEPFRLWLFKKGVKIPLTFVFAFVIIQILKIVLGRFLRGLIKEKDKLEKAKLKLVKERIRTLEKVTFSMIKTVIWTIAIITILPELGVNITPILTGLGIGGLALGLGAKNLIQDYISGLFILIEDQFRVGEEVEIGGKKGKVVDFNLRRTILKDKEGILYFIPNNQIKIATNFSRKRDEN